MPVGPTKQEDRSRVRRIELGVVTATNGVTTHGLIGIRNALQQHSYVVGIAHLGHAGLKDAFFTHFGGVVALEDFF